MSEGGEIAEFAFPVAVSPLPPLKLGWPRDNSRAGKKYIVL